jgi:DNA-binding NarL/FixJ family response regulator
MRGEAPWRDAALVISITFLSFVLAARFQLNELRDPVDGLSPRELEVLRLLAQGRSVREIAETTGLHPKTAANHQSVIKQWLGVDSALQRLQRAAELGLSPS